MELARASSALCALPAGPATAAQISAPPSGAGR
eukprot:COSAG01_NODE_751_length_13837_cov_78.727981_5_plen_33_part_00